MPNDINLDHLDAEVSAGKWDEDEPEWDGYLREVLPLKGIEENEEF